MLFIMALYAEVIRKVYVDSAFEQIKESGKRPTISSISAITGLTRKVAIAFGRTRQLFCRKKKPRTLQQITLPWGLIMQGKSILLLPRRTA